MAGPSLFFSSRAAANFEWLAPEMQFMPAVDASSTSLAKVATDDFTTGDSHRPATPADKRPVRPAPAATPPSSPPTHQRKQITVRRVVSVDMKAHKTYDKVVVDGWTVAATRHSVRQGQLAVFIEPDALLPAVDEHYAQFSQAGNFMKVNGKEYFRVATKSLGSPKDPRSQWVSQGLVLKLEDFPEINADVIRKGRLARFEAEQGLKEVVDYSHMLGVVKWEPHDTAGPNGSGSVKIPSFIKKTDMERVQNCPNLFTDEKYKHLLYQESIKLDGSSMTCYFVPKNSKYFSQLHKPHPGSLAQSVLSLGRFGVCSKNNDLPYSKDCPYWKAALANNLPVIFEGLHQKNRNGTIAIQGELIGPGMNGNHHGLPEGSDPEFHVFSVWDIQNQKRWDPRVVVNFCDAHNLKHVRVMSYHRLRNIADSHEDLITLAECRGGEGLVFKSCADGRWFKVLSSQWIIKQGDEKDAREANMAKTGGTNNNASTGMKDNVSNSKENNATVVTQVTNSGQVQEVQAETKSFEQQQANDNNKIDKGRPECTGAELHEIKIQEEKKMWIEDWLGNTEPTDEETKEEETLVADNMKPENAGEGTAEKALVVDQPNDANERTSEHVSIQDVEEKPAEKKAGELSDTPSPKEFDNVQDYLNGPVIWLGRPMTHREAIGEIGRVILAEMALHNSNVEASLKYLAEVVADELKFVETDKSVADQETAVKEDTPANISPIIPNTPNSPTSPDTPTTPNAPITPHESNPAMEPEIVSDAVTGPAELNAIGNPTPPASEHNDEQNEFAGVNWDDYKIIKRGGQLVCIRQEEYVPRSPPSLYPSAEEMARRREQRRRHRR
ncbi:hypothetical protein N0V85_008302 [Neurospora sp. IMI 360204]|nr:hypothetical protein N0V85_008302 [Neurospora sp. IMI 360204]